MIQKSDIQSPRMLANVPQLAERREAHASHSCAIPSETVVKGDCKEPRSGRDP
jgi:hypothetical protein